MRISAELRDYESAGSLAEELPYWGWLEDGRTCLTRTGELITAGRLAPAVIDGRSPELHTHMKCIGVSIRAIKSINSRYHSILRTLHALLDHS